MIYKSEVELRAWAADALPKLHAAGITAAIDSAHDYLIKLSIEQDGRSLGKLKVYHKPTKSQFKLDSGELREAVRVLPAIQAALDGLNVNTQVSSSAPRPSVLTGSSTGAGVKPAAPKAKPATPAVISSGWHIYVDGSYVRGRIGYGVVILKDGELHHTLHGIITDPDAKSVRQVAGELKATMEAIRWCEANAVTTVHIHHDYTGIAFWATGQWKTNTLITQEYADFMRKQPITIRWHKVAAHTGDYWNEMADRLAGGEVIDR